MAPRELFLVRHGKAVENAAGGDPARALTEEGRAGIEAVAHALAVFAVAPDVIVHSPYVRATETAQIIARVLGVKRLVAEGALTPVASGERAVQALTEAPAVVNAQRVLAVSHMPLLPAIAHELVGARIDFGTGTVAQVALFGGNGSVLVGVWPAEKLARVR
jgi:phosphohistidine phosphatase